MIYYNELDPNCAAWLKSLIAEGHLQYGDIDDRDIRDIKPRELSPYTQCHFFAGIGGWPLALSLAGIPTDIPLWTGSCPCQPFSAAGRRGGFADERHLWPFWHHLISQRKPPVVFGEQVASAADWLRLVRGDLEALDYAVGAIPIEAASAGADHLRDRYWFVAHEQNERHQRSGSTRRWRNGFANSRSDFHGGFTDAIVGATTGEPGSTSRTVRDTTDGVGLADAHGARLPERVGDRRIQPEALGVPEGQASVGDGVADSDFAFWRQRDQQPAGQQPEQQRDQAARDGGNVGHASGAGTGRNGSSSPRTQMEIKREWFVDGPVGDAAFASGSATGELVGFEWVVGADGKARRVVRGVRLLIDGLQNRVGLLRGFGNAIDPRPAAAFIKASFLAIADSRKMR